MKWSAASAVERVILIISNSFNTSSMMAQRDPFKDKHWQEALTIVAVIEHHCSGSLENLGQKVIRYSNCVSDDGERRIHRAR